MFTKSGEVRSVVCEEPAEDVAIRLSKLDEVQCFLWETSEDGTVKFTLYENGGEVEL